MARKAKDKTPAGITVRRHAIGPIIGVYGDGKGAGYLGMVYPNGDGTFTATPSDGPMRLATDKRSTRPGYVEAIAYLVDCAGGRGSEASTPAEPPVRTKANPTPAPVESGYETPAPSIEAAVAVASAALEAAFTRGEGN